MTDKKDMKKIEERKEFLEEKKKRKISCEIKKERNAF